MTEKACGTEYFEDGFDSTDDLVASLAEYLVEPSGDFEVEVVVRMNSMELACVEVKFVTAAD